MIIKTLHNPRETTQPPLLEKLSEVTQALRDARRPVELPIVKNIGSEFGRRREIFEGEGSNVAFRDAANELANDYHVSVQDVRADAAYLRSVSVLEATNHFVKNGITTVRYAMAFVFAGVLQDEQNRNVDILKQLHNRTHEMSQLSLPGKLQNVTVKSSSNRLIQVPQWLGRSKIDVPSNHYFLLKNTRDNYIALLTGDQITYDELHERGLYLLTNRDQHSPFAQHVIHYENGPTGTEKLVENKRVLDIGAGNGADAQYYLQEGHAQSVTALDNSECIYEHLQTRKEKLPLELQKKFEILEPTDMFDALNSFIQQNRKFDCITAHSSLHYFDAQNFQKLLGLIHRCLSNNGYFSFGVKAPGTTFDGHGIPLISKVESHRNIPSQEFVHERMWMNPDGQMRAVRSHESWEHLLSPYFEIRDFHKSFFTDYETPGQGDQRFYTFTCRPKEMPKLS